MSPFRGDPDRKLTKKVFSGILFTLTFDVPNKGLRPHSHTDTRNSYTPTRRARSGATQYNRWSFLKMIVKIKLKKLTWLWSLQTQQIILYYSEVKSLAIGVYSLGSFPEVQLLTGPLKVTQTLAQIQGSNFLILSKREEHTSLPLHLTQTHKTCLSPSQLLLNQSTSFLVFGYLKERRS